MLSLTNQKVRIKRHRMKAKICNIVGVITAILLLLLILVLAKGLDTQQKEEKMRPTAQNTEESSLIQTSQTWENAESTDTANQVDEENESYEDILHDSLDENAEANDIITEERVDSIPDRNEAGERTSEPMQNESNRVEESIVSESSIPEEPDSDANKEGSSETQNWGEEDWE